MQNIYIIGLSGAGKTSAAARIARTTDIPVYDSDVEIECRFQIPVSEIFKTIGEEGFRVAETVVIRDLSRLEGAIISLGGGAVVSEDNLKLIKEGKVIYLSVDIEKAFERISKEDSNNNGIRPLLAGGIEKLEALAKEREPIYKAAADKIIDTTDKTVNEVAEEILAYYYEIKEQ